MDLIVCTAGMGNVLQTSVCTSPFVLEPEVLWSGLCWNFHYGRTQLKIVQGPLNAVKYKDDILDPIVLPFLQQRNFNHVFQQENARCHVARVFQDFLSQNHIRVLPWPVFSPNLPQSEHLLDNLDRRACHRQNPPETLQELRDAFVHEWNSIPQVFI